MPLRRILFLIIMSCSLSTSSQYNHNLVPNYSFETHLSCKPEIISTAIPWQSPTMLKNYSAEYANSCDTNKCCGVPVNVGGFNYQMARTGEAYVAMYFMSEYGLNVRNYAQVQLTDSLVASKCYYTEFFVVLSDDGKFGVNNIGLLFSKTSVKQPGQGKVIIANPQILNFSNPIILDTMNWIKVSGVFTAQGGEKYITIGNFKNDTNTDTSHTNFPAAGHAGGYFLDDVSVVPLDSMNMKADAGRDTVIATGDSVFIGSLTGGLVNTKWHNSSGVVIATGVPGLYVKPTATTFYVLEQTVCGSNHSKDTVRVVVNPLPLHWLGFTATSPQPLSLGEGQEPTRTALLRWQTANEENVSHFNIQRSYRGTNEFENIGTIAAHNRSQNDYSFIDNSLLTTHHSLLYRIQSIDKDGMRSYSEIRRVTLSTDYSPLTVYPNPAKGKINVVGSAMIAITLRDHVGRVLVSKVFSSTNNCTLTITGLPRGVYVLQIKDVHGKVQVEKVVVE